MATGFVKSFDANRGFGFIVPDAGGMDLFFHVSQCLDGVDAVGEGARVRFEERASRRQAGKWEACAVALL
jgi:cold shock protein